MTKSRYDEKNNLSRHAATDEGKCEGMSRKYGWRLIEVERTPSDSLFKVDCVFEGKTEFPESYYETDKESM